MSERADEGEALRDRIEGSRQNLPLSRVPDSDPPETYTDLARDYPVALVAGGLVAGLLAGALLPRGAGRKMGKVIASGALMAGELGRNYSREAARRSETARHDGRDKIVEIGSRAKVAGQRTVASSRDLGIRAAREAIRLASNLRR
ncbi:MAG: hypothetical protein ACKOPO_13200 [Novosphingobium sp.]